MKPRIATRILVSSLPLILTSLWTSPFALAGDLPRKNDASKKATPEAKLPQEAKRDVRILQLPTDHSLGSVFVTPYHALNETYQIEPAKGRIVKEVPPGHYLGFDCGTSIGSHPEQLDKIDFSAIDLLKITFESMDEKSPSICDPILNHLSRFTNVKCLQVLRSDTTDVGLSNVVHMPHLISINAFQTSIKGGFLKNCTQLPLQKLKISFSPVDSNNLIYLPKLTKLDEVDLRGLHLTKTSLPHIVKCRKLRVLDLTANNQVDDSWLPELASLKDLRALMLHGTKVTLKGLQALQGTNLSYLSLPPTIQSKSDHERVQALLPHCKLVSQNGPKVTQDQQYLFSPLH